MPQCDGLWGLESCLLQGVVISMTWDLCSTRHITLTQLSAIVTLLYPCQTGAESVALNVKMEMMVPSFKQHLHLFRGPHVMIFSLSQPCELERQWTLTEHLLLDTFVCRDSLMRRLARSKIWLTHAAALLGDTGGRGRPRDPRLPRGSSLLLISIAHHSWGSQMVPNILSCPRRSSDQDMVALLSELPQRGRRNF